MTLKKRERNANTVKYNKIFMLCNVLIERLLRQMLKNRNK
jgi:hypothetical protein